MTTAIRFEGDGTRGPYWRSELTEGAVDDFLMLHGIGSSSESFEPQFSGLRGRVSLHAWDAPGYGKSADPPSNLSIEDYATEVARYARSIRQSTHRLHLIGVSWGGVIALYVAWRFPNYFSSVTAISSSAGANTSPERSQQMRARVDEFEREGVALYAKSRAPRLVSGNAPLDLIERVTSITRESVRLPGLASAAEMMASTDLRPILADINLPAFVVTGTEDSITGPAAGKVLVAGISGAGYFPIQRAGHLVNLERPDSVNSLLVAIANATA